MQQRRSAAANTDWFDKTFKDARGDVLLWQRPNIPLIGWLVFSVASIFVPRGTTQQVFYWLGLGSLIIWSLWEIVRGTNYFRRLLGFVVLAGCIAAIFNVGR